MNIATLLLTPAQAFTLLLARGLNQYDAYDILADSGFDPHPNASKPSLTLGRLNELQSEHEAFYAAGT